LPSRKPGSAVATTPATESQTGEPSTEEMSADGARQA